IQLPRRLLSFRRRNLPRESPLFISALAQPVILIFNPNPNRIKMWINCLRNQGFIIPVSYKNLKMPPTTNR
ncbi:hypothetical protein ACVGV8_15550, partial [Enterobacter intestinihominis]